MKVCIIRYNAGNSTSVRNALLRLGVEPTISDDSAVISASDRVIFPGVGEARSAFEYLSQRGLDRVITALTQPVLGICLGLQLLCAHSEEGNTPGLGIYSERVKRLSTPFTPQPPEGAVGNSTLKVPHMGWNTLSHRKPLSLLSAEQERGSFYFVHSYGAEVGPHTVATTTHGEVFSSVLQRDNFFAVQFHPEKSGAAGEALLRRFIEQ